MFGSVPPGVAELATPQPIAVGRPAGTVWRVATYRGQDPTGLIAIVVPPVGLPAPGFPPDASGDRVKVFGARQRVEPYSG